MTLALLLLVHDTSGSFGAAGAVVGAFGLAAAAGAPVLGRLVDRLGQPRVLTTCAAFQAAFLLALLAASHAHAPEGALVVLGAACGAAVPPISACVRVLWPQVVPDPASREAAFSLDATVQELVWASGPLLVGGAVALASPSAAVAAMAVATLLGTAWFATAPAARAWRPQRHDGPKTHPLALPGMRVLLGSSLAAGLAMGSFEVGMPGLAHELHAPGAIGALLALGAIGSLCGGLAFGMRAWRAPVEMRLGATLAAAALLMAPLLVVTTTPAALLAAWVSGLAWAPTLSSTYALVGRLAPPGAMTEAFTWNGAAVGGGLAAGVALGGTLVDAGGSAAAFTFGIAAALTAAAVVTTRRRALAPAAAHTSRAPAAG
jgi:predicted MFS family arabinose efflux permease